MTANTYTARVTRDGKWWMIHLPEIDGLTQARRVGEVEQMARELIAVTTGEPIADISVAIQHTAIAGIQVGELVSRINRDRRLQAAVSDRLARETQEAARRLVAAQVPLRDVGGLLGVSHQRVQQLVVSK